MEICAHIVYTKTRAWTLRIFGILFLYVGFSFGPYGTLSGTPLMRSINTVYPTWQAFIADIVITIFILAVSFVLLHTIFLWQKNRHTKKRMFQITKFLDMFLIRNVLDLFSIITRWSIACVCALAIMIISQTINLGYVPRFSTQPIIFSIAMIGIILIIESFAFWQKKLHHLFCLNVK